MSLVMYDLDGTLIDTAGEIAIAVNATLTQYGYEAVSQAQVTAWIGHGTEWLMQQAWPDKKAVEDSANWKDVMKNFMGHYNRVVGTESNPYPGAIKTLVTLKKLGVKQAIVTNKEEPYASRILAQHNIKGFFDLVISGNSLSVKKPNPAVIQHCITTLGEDKQNCLFVGDSEIDIKTAKSAGIVCWVVSYGYNAGRDIMDARPDKLISSLDEVPNFLNKLLKT